MKITSAQNLKVKQVMQLTERRERDRSGLFLIEGYRELSCAVQGGVAIQSLFICPDLFLGTNEQSLIDAMRAPCYECPKRIFEKISYRDRPDGLIAIAVQMRHQLHDLIPAPSTQRVPLFLVAESVEKPGNLGTMLRSADAVGASGVIVCDRRTDIYNPNVVRASVGTLFTIPVVEAEGGATLFWLRERGIRIIASTPHAPQEYTQLDCRGPIAILVGTEQYGLTEGWLQAADHQVHIPMRGQADSLNVAMAATLLLYEVDRQRGQPPEFQYERPVL